MSARKDLENAFSILDAGIQAHVSALQTAKAAAQDETYLQALTVKVIALADTLHASNPIVLAPVVPAAVVPSVQPLPSFLVPQDAQAVPVAQGPAAAPVPSVAPVAAMPDGHVPSLMETMAAAVKAMTAHDAK